MAKKERFHVTKREDGKWQGKKEGAERASAVGKTQKETFEKTRDIAKKTGESQIIIHRTNGKFREERTYGSDPYPPKG